MKNHVSSNKFHIFFVFSDLRQFFVFSLNFILNIVAFHGTFVYNIIWVLTQAASTAKNLPVGTCTMAKGLYLLQPDRFTHTRQTHTENQTLTASNDI